MASSSSIDNESFKRHSEDDITCTIKPKLTKTNSYIEGVQLEMLTWSREDDESYAKKAKAQGGHPLLPDLSALDELLTEELSAVSKPDELSEGIPDNSPKYVDPPCRQPKNLKKLSTLGRLSCIRASLWNTVADSVYHAFKVTPYIVNPNYVLRASSAEPYAKYERTIDFYLDNILPEHFPSWTLIENDIMKLVNLYQGSEDIANQLRNAATANELITDNILSKIANSRLNRKSSTTRINPLSDTTIKLEQIFKDFQIYLEVGGLNEKIFGDYLKCLLSYYFWTTQQIVDIERGENLTLDLSTNSEDRVMTVKSDFVLRMYNDIILAGEVKAFGVVPQQVKKSRGVHVTDPLQECQNRSHEVEQSEPDHDHIHMVASDAYAAEGKQYFRKLGSKEQHKVDYILPQLLAEMLAALNKNLKFGYSRQNESFQLGFTLDGFKLRFVRLVLRDAGRPLNPSVADITRPSVRCDVFLTREMNLLNPKHLRMFFQILHSIVHAYMFDL